MGVESCTNALIDYAQKLSQPISVKQESETYKVSIEKVVLKRGYVRLNISGYGPTIEEACKDYLLKAQRGLLTNWLTDQEVEIL